MDFLNQRWRECPRTCTSGATLRPRLQAVRGAAVYRALTIVVQFPSRMGGCTQWHSLSSPRCVEVDLRSALSVYSGAMSGLLNDWRQMLRILIEMKQCEGYTAQAAYKCACSAGCGARAYLAAVSCCSCAGMCQPHKPEIPCLPGLHASKTRGNRCPCCCPEIQRRISGAVPLLDRPRRRRNAGRRRSLRYRLAPPRAAVGPAERFGPGLRPTDSTMLRDLKSSTQTCTMMPRATGPATNRRCVKTTTP